MSPRTRWVCGAALVTTVSLIAAIVTARRAGALDTLPAELTFSNAGGLLATRTTAGSFEGANPFFASLGSNGRSCATYHRPASSPFTIRASTCS